MTKEPDYYAISRVWDAGAACLDCMHCHTVREPREYWGSTVYETYRQCDILDELVDGECPGVIAETEEDL